MAMKNTIFRNRMALSSWGLIAAGFAAAALIVTFLGEASDRLANLTSIAGLAVLTVAALFAYVLTFARRQVAELALVEGVLEAELFALVGHGRPVAIPLAAISSWHWASRTARGIKYSTLAFTFEGKEYRLPFNGAQVLDIEAFRLLAPGVFQA